MSHLTTRNYIRAKGKLFFHSLCSAANVIRGRLLSLYITLTGHLKEHTKKLYSFRNFHYTMNSAGLIVDIYCFTLYLHIIIAVDDLQNLSSPCYIGATVY